MCTRRIPPFHEVTIWSAFLVALVSRPAAAQNAFWSLQGEFQNATDSVQMFFDLTVSGSDIFYGATWGHSGGTNAVGDTVTAGGFDPILALFDVSGGGEVFRGENDDGYPSPNRDSLLTWPALSQNGGTINTDPLPFGDYRMDLTAYEPGYPSGNFPWAMDVLGPWLPVTLTGVAASGGASIQSLKFGGGPSGGEAWFSLDAAATPSVLVTDELVVGTTGVGRLFVNEGTTLTVAGGSVVGGGGDGEATIGGPGAVWNNNFFTVGDPSSFSSGLITVDNQGRLTSTEAAVGSVTGSGSVVINGFTPGLGLPATWEVTGSLAIGSAGFGSGEVDVAQGGRLHVSNNVTVGGSINALGRLSVQTNGQLTVGDTLTVDNNSTVELLGSEIRAASFIVKPNGTFTHGDGTLIVDGGTFNPFDANYTIDGFDSADLPIVRLANGASFAFDTPSVRIGDSRRGRLEVLNGSRVELFGGNQTAVGLNAGSEGFVVVDGPGAELINTHGQTIGSAGRGVLQILNGGSVSSNEFGSGLEEPIGGLASAEGMVEVAGFALDGTPSTWTTNGLLVVGSGGHGTLEISAGAHVNALAGARIANIPNTSNGSSVTVEGSGPLGPSTWDITGSLRVGGNRTSAGGVGTLTVENGGEVNLTGILQTGSTGSVELLGGKIKAGSIFLSGGTLNWTAGTLHITNDLFVAIDSSSQSDFGTNSLTIDSGMTLRVPSSSPDPTHQLFPSLDVGSDGTGSLTIQNGGIAESFYGNIGVLEFGASAASGTVTVSGHGSSWTVENSFGVGQGNIGTGHAHINGGGQVFAFETVIGSITGTGTVTVDGANSTLTSNYVSVGGGPVGGRFVSDGVGKLTVKNGATVNAPVQLTINSSDDAVELLSGQINSGSFIVEPGGNFNHKDGTLIVDGGVFDPGTAGYTISGAAAGDEPTLELINGATGSFTGANPELVQIGSTGNAALRVIGGSRFEASHGIMDIGWIGSGRLELLEGGVVDHTGTFVFNLGVAQGASGTVMVDGADSQVNTGGLMIVGDHGQGSLAVTRGGRVIASRMWIAHFSDAQPSDVLVSGNGGAPGFNPSSLQITGSLFVSGEEAQGSGVATTMSVTDGGQVSIADTLKVWPAGTVQLDGGTIQVGGVDFAGGRLEGTGRIDVAPLECFHNDGSVAPGLSAELLTIAGGDYVQQPGGTLEIQIGGTAFTDFSQLRIESGAAMLDGKLDVSLVGGFSPSLGMLFEILTAENDVFGTFSNVNLHQLGSNLTMRPQYIADTVILAVVSALAGDYNSDGTVNAADYTVWRNTLGATGVGLPADGDGSGMIDPADYDVWKANFGASMAPTSALTNSLVPEPNAGALLAFGGLLLVLGFSIHRPLRGQRKKRTMRALHVVGAVHLVGCLTASAPAQDAYISLEGEFLSPGDQHDFFFNLERSVGSGESLRFETFASGGGTNAAGQVLPSGGIDSLLDLFDSGNNLHGHDDDGSFNPGTDSLLSWPGVAQADNIPLTPDPLNAGSYRLNLSEFNNDDPGHWAVDLVSPADALTFTGDTATGSSELSRLTAGGGAQVRFDESYELNGGKSFTILGGADMTVTSFLDIGNSSDGFLLVSGEGSSLTTNTESGTFLDWGQGGANAEINVEFDASATFDAAYINLAADSVPSSRAILYVLFGGDVTLNTLNVGTGSGTGQIWVTGNVINGNDSTLTQNGNSTLTIGDNDAPSGIGLVHVSGEGTFHAGAGGVTVNRTGAIFVSGGTFDTAGNVTVGGVGGGAGARAGVDLREQGQIVSGDVTVGTALHDGSVLIDGFVPGIGVPAAWDVTGSMNVGTTGFGAVDVVQGGRLNVSANVTVGGSGFTTGRLTVQTSGQVTVGDTITVDDFGLVELLGSEIHTGSFIVDSGGTFTHQDGTLIVDRGTFDPGVRDYTLEGGGPTDLPVVRLTGRANASLTGDAYVGRRQQGRIEILGGSQVNLRDSGSVLVIGPNFGRNGEVIVDGMDSKLTTDSGILIGEFGRGVLRIRGGGAVSDQALPADQIGRWAGSEGFVEVSGVAIDGTPSTYATNGPLVVGVDGHGTLEISAGGQVNALDGARIAATANTSDGSSATVEGSGPLGPSTWDITGSLWVGGSSNAAGGAGTLTVENGGKVDVSGTLQIWSTGTVELMGGEIEARSFLLEPGAGGTFTHHDGTLTVNGGTFDPVDLFYRLDGAAPDDLPVIQFTGRANVSLAGTAAIGLDHRGIMKILNGSQLDFPDSFSGICIGFRVGGDGEVIVDGKDSKLTTDAGIFVGESGRGVLRIRGGGTVSDRASTGEYIGALSGSEGIVEVTGAAQDGTSSTWTTNGEIKIGHYGHGTLLLSAGGHVNALAGALIAATPDDSNGSGVTVEGSGPLGPSTFDITGPLWVGGSSTSAGGVGTLLVADGGLAKADDVRIWQPGTVELQTASAADRSTVETGSLVIDGRLIGSGNLQLFAGGAVTNQGTVAPGPDIGATQGEIRIAGGDYVQDSTGTLHIEIGGVNANQFDELHVFGGTSLLDGTLEVSLIDPTGGGNIFQPAPGNSFEILFAENGISSTFTSEVLPDLGPDLIMRTIYGANAVTLIVESALLTDLPGDYNRNGTVDAADYTVWRNTVGQNVAAFSGADGNGDGVITQLDYNVWRINFGNRAAGSGSAGSEAIRLVAPVPEPCAFALCSVTVCIWHLLPIIRKRHCYVRRHSPPSSSVSNLASPGTAV